MRVCVCVCVCVLLTDGMFGSWCLRALFFCCPCSTGFHMPCHSSLHGALHGGRSQRDSVGLDAVDCGPRLAVDCGPRLHVSLFWVWLTVKLFRAWVKGRADSCIVGAVYDVVELVWRYSSGEEPSGDGGGYSSGLESGGEE